MESCFCGYRKKSRRFQQYRVVVPDSVNSNQLEKEDIMISNITMRLVKPAAYMACMLIFAVPAQALTWGTPTAVGASTIDPAMSQSDMNPSEDIDVDGNTVAVWVEVSAAGNRQVWSKSRNNGVWTAKVLLDKASAESFAPQVEVSAGGNATAVWSTAAGLWSADRPKGKGWKQPVLLVPGLTAVPLFSMNNRGDALLTYSLDTASVMAVRRTAGSAWTQPEVMALGQPYIASPLAAVMSDNGDAMVAWNSYQISPHGFIGGEMLHVSREAKGSTVWQDSGVLADVTSTLSYFHPALLADAQGRTGVLYFDYANDNIVASTQTSAGQVWTPPAFVINACTFCYQMQNIDGIKSDAAGNVTLIVSRGDQDIYTDIVSYTLTSVSGKLSSNSWGPETAVPGVFNEPIYLGLDVSQSFNVKFNVAANGNALLLWNQFNYDPNTGTLLSSPVVNKYRVGNTWGRTTTFPGQVGDIKLNADGKAAVLYQTATPTSSGSTLYTLYAVNSK